MSKGYTLDEIEAGNKKPFNIFHSRIYIEWSFPKIYVKAGFGKYSIRGLWIALKNNWLEGDFE